MSDNLKRIEWMDTCRGIGIILVVVGHVLAGLRGANIANTPFWYTIEFTIYTFHMPLFFVLAGFNAKGAVLRGRWTFFQSKIWTVAYPYFLWSVIQGLALLAVGRLANSHGDLSDMITIPWHPGAQFWFLYVLMLATAALAIIGYHPRFLTILALAAMVGEHFFEFKSIPELFLSSVPFYFIGSLFSDKAKSWHAIIKPIIPIALWVAFGISVYGALIFKPENYHSALVLPAAAFGILATMTTSKYISGWAARPLAYLGQASMTIYVLHILAASGMRIIMTKLHIPTTDWVYVAICTVIGIAAPVVAHMIFVRFKLLVPLGLAQRAKKAPVAELPKV